MSDAGDARPFVGTAYVRNPAAGNGRLILARDHEQSHAVGELFFNDGTFCAQEEVEVAITAKAQTMEDTGPGIS